MSGGDFLPTAEALDVVLEQVLRAAAKRWGGVSIFFERSLEDHTNPKNGQITQKPGLCARFTIRRATSSTKAAEHFEMALDSLREHGAVRPLAERIRKRGGTPIYDLEADGDVWRLTIRPAAVSHADVGFSS